MDSKTETELLLYTASDSHCKSHISKKFHLSSSLTYSVAKVFDEGHRIRSKDTQGHYANCSEGMAMIQTCVLLLLLLYCYYYCCCYYYIILHI